MARKVIKTSSPLQSWDIFAQFLIEQKAALSKKADLQHLDIFKSKHKWLFDFQSILLEEYTTIVITDNTQKIQWVNAGFSEMTGYAKSFAIGKHPRFLQGKDTSSATKGEIRNALKMHATVSKQLLNYRKDGTSYLCDIKIIPLHTKNQEVTHYLALEKKAKVA